MNSHALQAGIEALRGGFLTRVAERVMAIDAIVERSGTGMMSDAERGQIAQHAHKTAGVAATFGFFDLGGAASVVEELLTRSDAELEWADALDAIEELLDQMERALDSAD